MPDIFEVEHNGQLYQVEANSFEEAATAFDEPAKPKLDANALTQQFARQTRLGDRDFTPEQDAQGARNATAGVKEGGRMLWAGLKQFGANTQDAYNLFVKGVPSDYEKQIRDPATNALLKREVGLLETSKAMPVIAEEMLREQLQIAEDREAGINIPARNTAAGATQLGALALAPEAALPRATTMVGGMLKNSAAGGLGGALEFDAEPSNNALLGAGAAPVLGFVPSVVPAVKNYVGRALAKVSRDGRTAARLASARKVSDVDFSLAQMTGVPELKTLERAAYDSDQVNFFADQTDKFIADAVKALRQPIKGGQTLEGDFLVARTKAEAALSAQRMNASKGYEDGIAMAEGMSPGYIQADNLRTAFEGVKKQSEDTLANGGKTIISKEFLGELSKVFTNPKTGGPRALSTQELARTLRGLTVIQKSDDAVERALGSKLREAIDADLDAVAQGGNIDKATKQLLDTRAEYRRAAQANELLATSASYKLLGVDEPGYGPDELVARLKTFTPEKRGTIRTFMEQNSPELLLSMKDAVVRDAAKRAQTVREAADSQQSLDQMLDAMFDAKNGFDMRTAGVWNADELKRIESIKDGMRVIANNRPAVGGAGTPIKPEDIAINLVSRSGIFGARQAVRVLMSTKASQFFLDPRVHARMTKINRSTTGSPVNLMARAALLDLMQTDYLEQSQEQESQ
jgi:hypothetical protein